MSEVKVILCFLFFCNYFHFHYDGPHQKNSEKGNKSPLFTSFTMIVENNKIFSATE